MTDGLERVQFRCPVCGRRLCDVLVPGDGTRFAVVGYCRSQQCREIRTGWFGGVAERRAG